MDGKVAVFIREGLEYQLHKLAKEYPKIEFFPLTYEKTEQIISIVERAFMCDIYIFTEPLSYLYVKEKVKKKRVPFINLYVNEYMIFHALSRLKKTENKQLRISIDLPDQRPLNLLLEDYSEPAPSLYVYDYSEENQTTIEEIAAYHEQLWNENKVDHIITSSLDVKNKLAQASIPATTIELAYSTLVAAAKETESLITLHENDNALVVFGYVAAKAGAVTSEVTLHEVEAILKEFAKKTDSSVTETADNRFTLVGTKALLDHIKSNYGSFPLLNKIKAQTDVPMNIAFGLGLKGNQAQYHAGIALEKCEAEEESIAYVVNEREDVIGPLGVKKHINTSKLYQALIHKARLNNELSYNFINFIKKRNNEPFSSHDVASFYNVTKRSAERTVNKLHTGEVIKVSGEERPYEKGRPRKLFTLNI